MRCSAVVCASGEGGADVIACVVCAGEGVGLCVRRGDEADCGDGKRRRRRSGGGGWFLRGRRGGGGGDVGVDDPMVAAGVVGVDFGG